VCDLCIFKSTCISFCVIKISIVSIGTPVWNSAGAHIVLLYLIWSLFTCVECCMCEREVKSWNAWLVSIYILFGLPNRGDGSWKAKKEMEKTFELHVKWITTPWADFAVIGVQLCSTIRIIICRGIFWLNWMAQGFFVRFVFMFNFLNVNYFSFLDMLGLVIHHFWWKEYFTFSQVQFWYYATCGNRISTMFWFATIPSPNPIFSIREIVVLCMGESEIPYLRLWSH